MFNSKVPELASFLNHQVRELDEVLSQLVTHTMANLEVSSAFMYGLSRHNRVELIGQFGVEEKFLTALPSDLTVFDTYPFTDSLRNRKTVWITTLPNWGKDYPTLDNLNFSGSEKTFFCIALERDDVPVASLCFFAAPSIERTEEIDLFLETVSNLISLNFFRHSKKLENRLLPRTHMIRSSELASLGNLTERQTMILKLMSENCINLEISKILGYSESTIRQESIKIYEKLNCNGREVASQIYNAQIMSLLKD
jgi:DNA-binding CsgD family transcriptional regulator